MNWFTPTCRCGADAAARLIMLWKLPNGDYEEGRQQPVCVLHRDELLDLFERLRTSAPDSVEDLTLTLGAA